jgi:hypothetical protein
MPLAIFGIDNTGISLGITLTILALVAIWVALIVFTFSDARRRISDPFLVGAATAASFFPFVGTVVYTILRPPELLDDVNERETEMKAAETRIRHLHAHACHKCGFPTEADFVRCPACRSRLKDPCPSCSRPVGLNWKVCPYCEHTLIASKRSRSGAKGASKGSPEARRRPSSKPADGREASSRGKRAPSSPAATGETEATGRKSRSDRKAPGPADETTRDGVAGSGPGRGEPTPSTPGRRSGRRASRQDTATRSGAAPPEPGGPDSPGDPDSPERPARGETGSSRHRTVNADDEPLPTRTINGGDADSSGRAPEAG